MKTKILFILCAFSITMGFSQVIITDKTNYAIDNSAILKLDSDSKGFLFPRISLNSKSDISTIPSPQNGNVVFNTNIGATNLLQSVVYFDQGQWNFIYTLSQSLNRLDLVNINLKNSLIPTSVTNYSNLNFSIGDNINSTWNYLNLQENVTLSRIKNSLAFSVEGMVQVDKNQSLYFDYAIAVFVDDKLAVVRKYHKNKENNTVCQWDKFILNGVISGLSVGNHVIKVYGKTLDSSATPVNTILIYGGVGRTLDTGNPPCTNMSNFMSKIILNTTVVESL